ncbi:MAG: heme biosynthesis HemY N-terminal domain-containing protein [Alphaproteobacteria bacterium]
MKGFIGFILRLSVLIALAVWLADRPGTARIIWHDYVIETSAAFLGLCGFALGFIFYLLFRFWHLIKFGPLQWRLHRKLRKMKQGQDQLTAGMVAIASGNASEAGRMAISARKALGPTAATQLLQAQAAQLAGDHKAARALFQQLAANSESAILGFRGLIMEARRDQDWGEVAHLVSKLRDLKPNTPWLNVIRFELLTRQQAWHEAGLALTQATAAQLMDGTTTKQARAAILTAQSQNEARFGSKDKSLQLAEQAVKQAPDWLPGIINLAQKQMLTEHHRAAHRTIEKNWQLHPHPHLAAAYRTDGSNPMDAYKHIMKLCRDHETLPESRLALAEAALAADIWGEARRHLIALISHGHATQKTYRLMARLERRESGDEQAALQWMTKAADAAADPVWLCQSCGGGHEDWQPICKYCSGFNTLAWQSPGVSRAPAPKTSLLGDNWID